MKEVMVEKSLDSELWHACAGGMVQMPRVNSKVFYFPQGHAEHTLSPVDFGSFQRIPSLVLCKVAGVRFLADPETDEVYAKISLAPVAKEHVFEDDDGVLGNDGSERNEKPNSFAKTLTQSDANNGGGFSVPRYCAETIFPKLDYNADPPVQNLIARDVLGEAWKFRHIYRGTPRRHLLTTGWSSFVNQKKLVAGDSIVFLKAENGDLSVGIRRAKRGGGIGGNEISCGWNSGSVGNYGGFSSFLKDDENKMISGVNNGSMREKSRVKPESVIEAAYSAANGKPFEVVYYPRASTPEFCVKASSVNTAMRIQWCAGMRFKMPFETEDSSRISWFMGTVASVKFSDPNRWPSSPWRLLQVSWDEPDLLQNVKSVSPWLVEVVSNIPTINLSPFLPPPRKKMRLPPSHHHPLDGQFIMPSFSGNPLLGPTSSNASNITASTGIQGARHAHIGIPLSDLHLSNKLHMGILPPTFLHLDHPHHPNIKIPDFSRSNNTIGDESNHENISCVLSIGSSHNNKPEKTDSVKTPGGFVLFGQPILTEQQMSKARSYDLVSKVVSSSGQRFSGFAPEREDLIPKCFPVFWKSNGYDGLEVGMDTGHCKVFLESEDVGRTLDLSILGSYEELYKRLEHMFGIERLEMISHVFYRDAAGVVKQIGDESFSVFMKSAKRLTIFMKSSSNSGIRKLITGLPTARRGLGSSNQAGPLSIFA